MKSKPMIVYFFTQNYTETTRFVKQLHWQKVLCAITLIKRYFTTKELLQLVNSNFLFELVLYLKKI